MAGFDIERVLELPPQARAERLIKEPESQWYERKSVRVDTKAVARALIAFANAEGGSLIVGIHDGNIEGLEKHPDVANRLRRVPIEMVVPPVRAKVTDVTVEDANGLPQTVLAFSVEPSSQLHRATDESTYIRAGDSTLKLNYVQERELMFDRTAVTFESEVADADLEELDSELIEAFASTIGHPSPERSLFARHLLTRDSRLTNAAYLLFATDPERLFPNANIRVVSYLENSRGEGASQSLQSGRDIRISGPLLKSVIEAQEVIAEWMPQRRILSDSGRFTDTSIVPQAAWLEGLVNATVHRSYSLVGDHIRVELFPNRIEITSPGRFPGLADPSKPLEIPRYSRNPRIARVCSDMGLTQELGEGIRRMFTEMRRLDLTDPIFEQTAASVRLTLRATTRLDSTVAKRLPKGSAEVLTFLEQTGRAFGTGEIALALDRSRPTVLKQLNALRTEGLVTWEGKSARDPRASWSAASTVQ
ncbi:ATP-dependent DNA helicase RecG [Paramicrobacterium humi]|uniref:ATP-dependent DNA helicase RecG n=1 Tax=Paramicrobacterium humi TaxID=640635 RepID=A0A1H4KW73_9MICO|nr:ATP-binding protein [Microbacterium humi]SEB62784.1 ATP-dependent DNA helicase RecG [Microbacterium humi]